MHVRPRKTRILYQGKFFAYPVELSPDTVRKLGFAKIARIAITYLYATLFPIRPERTLEEFFINRFGRELYATFFQSYTEKVWGTTCKSMSAEWGAQRVKGLSILKAVEHAVRKVASVGPLSGKTVQTSLIEQFLYPTYGPGQMWENVAKRIRELGGDIRMGTRAVELRRDGNRIVEVVVSSEKGVASIESDFVFSSTDVQLLLRMVRPSAPDSVLAVSDLLEYRDFITVGLLMNDMPKDFNGAAIADTWLYIHDPTVEVGRIQLFHNWHPKLVANPAQGWVGLEYFVKEGDNLWSMDDQDLIKFGTDELAAIGLARGIKVIDGTVIRQPKAYPGYFGSYTHFDKVRMYLDGVENLFPVGRNGMHRYNNQDHSMLTAMIAVDNIIDGITDKSNLWAINTEGEYHEEKK